MSLKLVNCLLAPGAFHSAVPPAPSLAPLPPRHGLRALVESFSRKYLILAVTDNVVRPPDGFLRRYYKRPSVRGTLDYSRLCCNPFNPHCIKIFSQNTATVK